MGGCARAFTVALVSIVPLASIADPISTRTAERTWITDVTIVSPERLDRIEKGSVLIEDGRIIRVDRGTIGKQPAGATAVSGKGQFLIPGLIDSHVHLVSVPGTSPLADSDSEMTRAYFKQLPRSYLYFGYTTLVDLIVMNPKVLDDFRRAPLHPDLHDCGEAIIFANGYPMSFAPPEARFKRFSNFIYDASQSSRIPPEYKPEDHTPAAAIARVKKAGAICAKTFHERGFGRDRNLPVMSADVFAELRRAATQSGLVLLTHANSFDAQRFAAEGGTDVLAHGMWHWGELDKQTELPAEIRKLLDLIVERKIGYQPTFQVLYGELAYFDPEYLKSAAIPKVIPKEMLAWLKSPEGQWFKKELDDGSTPDAVMRDVFERGPLRRLRAVVAYLASKDANFVFGTDTPSGPTYGNLPGLNGYLEMQQLRKTGLSLPQIFRAATIGNARQFKLDAQIGTIEPGKVANLVLLKRSPLETLDAYDSIVTVWIGGKRVSRESLAADAR
jgi:imidazolonepropionase-like amidohydrolase